MGSPRMVTQGFFTFADVGSDAADATDVARGATENGGNVGSRFTGIMNQDNGSPFTRSSTGLESYAKRTKHQGT